MPGLSAALVAPLSLPVLTVLFSEAGRPRAVGVWAAANFLALPIGPIPGGWLLSNYWWGWVFLMNLPVVLAGMIAVILLIPESRSSFFVGALDATLWISLALAVLGIS
ncbi:MAG: MFS transporter [Actinobacteria bacterium]|nr:MFS transporter [Actinomycetota bacterium]